MIGIFFSLFAVTATAQAVRTYPWMGTLSEKRQSYKPPSPYESLKEFTFIDTKKKVLLDEREEHAFFMSVTRAVLRTDTVAHIEDYAIVQYIRGCIFESTWDGKKVTNWMNISRDHFGQIVPFKHPVFTIDTDNPDPTYSSYPGYGRFALLRWNTNPASFEGDTATYYANAKPPHPIVFTSDIPGPATLNEDGPNGEKRAQNTSLEFKVCLFRSTDVPYVTDVTGVGLNIQNAVQCFDWEHKHIYNFKRRAFDSGGKIHPFCLQ